jgi:hypothetical protein
LVYVTVFWYLPIGDRTISDVERFGRTASRSSEARIVTIAWDAGCHHIEIRNKIPSKGVTVAHILTWTDGYVLLQDFSCCLVGNP